MFYVDQLTHLLVCLVCQEAMAIKNFIFRKTKVGNEVTDMKIAFVAMFEQSQTNIFAPKCLKDKDKTTKTDKDKHYLISNYVT